MDSINEDAPLPDQTVHIDDTAVRKRVIDMITSGDYSGVSELVAPRVAYLEAHSSPVDFGGFHGETVHHGYFHSGSEIYFSDMIVYGFHPDDPELYTIGLQQLSQARRVHPDASPNALILNSLPFLMYAYYGNVVRVGSDAEVSSSHYLEEGDASIRRLKGSGNSVCITQAMAAQNFLSFVGVDTTMVAGRVEFEGNTPDLSRHAYNIFVMGDKIGLLETHNPEINEDKDKKVRYIVRPGIYQLSSEQRDSLLKGGSVTVALVNYVTKDGKTERVIQNRTYFGPGS